MLLPENPEKRPTLWTSVATQLAQESMCSIIEKGVGNLLAKAKKPTKSITEVILSRLQAAQVCRISANHGRAVSPHFAGQLEGDTVFLTEFLTYSSDGQSTVESEKLRRDLETAVINLFFAGGNISAVFVPLHLPPWVMQDAQISQTEEGLIFKKIDGRRLG